MQYNIKTEAFEGPLDLLLHLINRYEIDIYDIPVAVITEQYLSYIHAMQELQLDVASEYLVMAATLLAIKSKMLLPKQEEPLLDEDGEMMDDPRQDLMERLIEYKKYKEAANELKQREQERAELYTRPPLDLGSFQQKEAEERLPVDVTLYDMLAAFQKLLRRKKLQKPITTRVARQEIPIEQRMEEVLHQLEERNGRSSFFDLFPQDDREAIVVTFLAVLELLKKNLVLLEQERNFEEIFLLKP
ncbi:segregation/condensation protein A [Ectobacillus ponti]|uniref:Segregation and condensation protein A n=1 Tax=Ectobacillus ponti TaxID=2961894 RepID=A0AA42BMS3_9BACI|nr:segregation/condensation protein A [Ectobacillus ponti]MCP8966927.1 segregation/condensation protein A [Ectobacillus ponti]